MESLSNSIIPNKVFDGAYSLEFACPDRPLEGGMENLVEYKFLLEIDEECNWIRLLLLLLRLKSSDAFLQGILIILPMLWNVEIFIKTKYSSQAQ